MTAGKHDITVEKGAQFEITLSIASSGGEFDNGIGSHTFQAMVREHFNDAAPALTFQTSIFDPGSISVAGVLLILSPSSATAEVNIGKGNWDLEAVRDSDGEVIRLLQGEVVIMPNATR